MGQDEGVAIEEGGFEDSEGSEEGGGELCIGHPG